MLSTSAVKVATALTRCAPGLPRPRSASISSQRTGRSSSRREAALDDARQTLDLTRLEYVLEQWRRIALLQADPASSAGSCVALRRS
ncbi:DUF6247 family protein [Actinomycetospora atypica]|uniref:DUF6247 family protein n=1 Tax=Actinomycetospora atypica TaxID=1290095 RepID=A0ABV9YXD5_9PSEU